MKLQEVIQFIDQLTSAERAQLRDYLDHSEENIVPDHLSSPEERIRRLDEAARAIREDMTEQEWAVVEQVMNAETIEVVDEDVWKD